MPIFARDTGVWQFAEPRVRDGGVWKTPKQVYVKDGGIWKPAYADVTGVYGSHYANSSQLTTYTFAATGLATSGYNLIAIMSREEPTRSIASMTVDGVAAKQIWSFSNYFSAASSVWFWIAKASGSAAGDVVVNWTGTGVTYRCGYANWAVNNLISTDYYDANGDDTDTATRDVSVNTLDGGAVFAATYFSSTSLGATYTGVTERFDAATSPARYSGGEATGLTAETPRTVTAAWSASDNVSVTAAISMR